MKTKTWLPQLAILAGLLAVIGAGYALARLLPDFGGVAASGLPPLSKLDLAPQTVDGITASVESYYADATRLVFRVRVTGGEGVVDNVNLYDESGGFVNASTTFGLVSDFDPASNSDPTLLQIEFEPVTPLPDSHLKGQLTFAIVTSRIEGETLARFRFDLNIPVRPAQIFNPKQSVKANGVEILLDRVVVTPAYTQVYLCYIHPTPADWMISDQSSVQIGFRQASVRSYSLLFDSLYSMGDKGGEPSWAPPVHNGRCVKVGFPVGDAHPKFLTLTIPELQQSMPEVIPDEDLSVAYEILGAEGIEMKWHKEGNGAYPEWKKLPEGMSEQDAFYQFMQALGYFHYGPWIFEIPLDQQGDAAPKFTTSTYGAMTPIPYPSEELGAATTEGRIRSFDLNSDGKTIALATSHGIILWNLDHKNVHILNETENFFSLDWSPDGKKLAAGGLIMQDSEIGKPHLVVWDISSWKAVFEPKLDDSMTDILYGDVAWSPDSRFLATSNGYMGVTIFDIRSGKVISRQDIFSGAISDISWSPDGSRLVATGDMAYAIRRWRVDTDDWVRLFDPRASFSLAVQWSPDGKRIASGHTGGAVCFWTAETNECDGFIQAHQSATFSLAWSPDETRLATGGGVIRIWNTQTGLLDTSFGLSDTSVYSKLAWPNPDLLISLEAGYEEEMPTIVRFWDLSTGKILMEFQGASGLLWQ